MKTPVKCIISTVMMALFAALVSLSSFAQGQQKVTVTHEETTTFWGSPWMWVIGAAIFILLLAAILRGGNNKAEA